MKASTARSLAPLLPALLLACASSAGTVTAAPVSQPQASAPAAVEADAMPIASAAAAESLLVDVRSLDPTIVVDLRYDDPGNFTGAPLPGYGGNRALLRREAAKALARVQDRLRAQGLGLKVFDAYRPARATEAMVAWTERVGRRDLIDDGYIASRSRHNLGAAIDLTLVDLQTGRELDMGTPFDTFDETAHTANATGEIAANRQRLVAAMEAEGFENYDREWWHFSYPIDRPQRFDLPITAVPEPGLPAGADSAEARLAASPRHGEWAMIAGGAPADSVRAWVVYPERRERAPVVLVVHEIFGLTPWIRAVADQLAADGFIAIAPDLLTGKLPAGYSQDTARLVIRTLAPAEVHRRLDAVARYGMALPAALPAYGVIGFCWGGAVSFAHAVHAPSLDAAIVYYGTSPPTEQLASIQAPVLGLYGGDDARVNATIAPADSAMRALGKVYRPRAFAGAGHGFLRAQSAREGANMAATREAWPLTIAFLRRHIAP